MLFPKKHQVLITTIIVISAFLLLFHNLRRAPESGLVRKTTLAIISPLETSINLPFKGLKDIWRRYIFLVGLEAENRRLKDQNDRLAAEVIRYREGYYEGVRLQKLLQIKGSIPYPTVGARVAGRNYSSLFKIILINRGEAEGVRTGQPVVAAGGIVGRIWETSWHVSRVLLLTDENSKIDALVQESRVQGILQGAAGEGAILKYVSKTSEVRQGDTVVSSGMGGLFPKGLPIGLVRSVSKKEADLFQKIYITPFVDPEDTEEVLVIMLKEEERK